MNLELAAQSKRIARLETELQRLLYQKDSAQNLLKAIDKRLEQIQEQLILLEQPNEVR